MKGLNQSIVHLSNKKMILRYKIPDPSLWSNPEKMYPTYLNIPIYYWYIKIVNVVKIVIIAVTAK